MNILRNQIESESHLQYRGYKPDKFYQRIDSGVILLAWVASVFVGFGNEELPHEKYSE